MNEDLKRVISHDQIWRQPLGSLARVRHWLARDEPIPPITFSLVCDIEVLVDYLCGSGVFQELEQQQNKRQQRKITP
jgi:hypothetical protein